MKAELFSAKSYKHYLDYRWRSERGLLSRAAEFIPTQRSYLSRVIHSKVQLTPDQAYRLCEFFSFTPDEQKFFLLLVEYERASTPNYRSHLKDQIEEIKREAETQQKKGNKTLTSLEASELTYFISLHLPAIHFLTSIQSLQTPEKIAARLNQPLELVKASLNELCAKGFVEKNGARYVFKKGNTFLSPENPVYWAFASNLRDRAKMNFQLANPKDIHFSILQTVSKKDIENLREVFLRTINEYNRISAPSEPEELICFNLDFFKF